MASESKEIKVKVGTKLTDAEVKALNPKDIAKLYAQPKKSGVEGQYNYVGYQICPYCGCSGTGMMSTEVFRYFTCHCCGGTFRA
jgi:Rieske Fe-S protein